MPVLAVYIIPHAEDTLYRVGTDFLGYDVRMGKLFEPMLWEMYDKAGFNTWLGRARIFGFHATLGDALEYAEDAIPEVKTRLRWIAKRIPSFTLINGRFHETFRNVPKTLAATFDSPDGRLQELHHLVVTAVNVLYRSSPFFEPNMDSFDNDNKEHLIRYGVPHFRILDKFDLHFAFATGIPNHQTYERLRDEIVERTGLFHKREHRVLEVDEFHLLERQSDGYFHIIATYPLGQ